MSPSLDQDLCYEALATRDARFDGRFFTAVLTTGIYCRPICPARTPLRKNVRFYACAAAAQADGFRPCRRCRPEAAPGSPRWQGVLATVTRALRRIEQGALDESSVAALAAQLGVGERHLRRLFQSELGAGPQAIAAARRAHCARTLLEATDRPVTEIALASGFGSVRQFNAEMRRVFQRAPSELRRPGGGGDRRAETCLRLAFRPPLDWTALLGFLRARALPGVEVVDASGYRRAIGTPDAPGRIAIEPAAGGSALVLRAAGCATATLLDLQRRARRLCDLDADPLAIRAALAAAPLVGPAVSGRPGLRLPGAWDAFETLWRAVLGQQVSVAAATTLSGRLIERCGARVELGGGLDRLSPTPQAIAADDLRGLGLPAPRAQRLRQLAARVAEQPSLLEPAADLEALITRLTALPGVGAWTAHYVAMRAASEVDAFPSGDLALCRASGLSPAALEAQSQAWRPFRAYAAVHLWAQRAPTKEDHAHLSSQP